MKLWGMVDFKRLLRILIDVTIIHIVVSAHLNGKSNYVQFDNAVS